jgi:hypothetical protein
MIPFAGYVFFGVLSYFWIGTLLVGGGWLTKRQAQLGALVWPLMILAAVIINQRRLPPKRPPYGRPDLTKPHGAPQHADYSEELFPGKEEEEGKTPDPVFENLMTQEEELLREEITVTYSPTGVSRTYPPGTPFPAALRRDWEEGLFKRRPS